MKSRVTSLLIAALLGLAAGPRAQSLLENGALTEWRDGLPVGWESSTGARNGEGPTSRITPLGGGGVALSGAADTGEWRYLAQPFAVEAGATYRARFAARLLEGRVDARQFDNAYVGLVLRDEAGRVVRREVEGIAGDAWEAGSLLVEAAPAAATGELALFLSHTGRMEVRETEVTRLAPEDSYDLLVDEMTRRYAHLELSGLDWAAHTRSYRASALAAQDERAFVEALRAMLAGLHDMHVWIETSDGRRVATYAQPAPRNFDYEVVARTLRDAERLPRTALFGRTPEGFGYVALATFQLDEQAFAGLEPRFCALFDAPGLILDVRANGGGDETWARRLAGHLTAEDVVYGYRRVRSGPAPGDLGEPLARVLRPAGEPRYERPVVCLVGPNCGSSAEGFALMMKALPQVTLVGQATRGSSGNPAPLRLPNHVTVYYSRWLALDLDGEGVEGRGVLPDVRVEHQGEGDPTYAAARRELSKRIGAGAVRDE